MGFIRSFNRSIQNFCSIFAWFLSKPRLILSSEAPISKRLISVRGAAIVELTMVLCLIAAVTVPSFVFLLPKLGIVDRRTKIQVGYSRVAGAAYSIEQMNLEGIMVPVGDCKLVDQLYNNAYRLAQHTGISGFCAVALSVDVDAAGVASNPHVVLSSDDTGSDCADDSSLPAGFVAQAASGLNADLARTQLAMGTFIDDPGGPLMAKQRVVATTTDGPASLPSTSCSCTGGTCS